MSSIDAFVIDVESLRFCRSVEVSKDTAEGFNVLFLGAFDRVWDHVQMDILPKYEDIDLDDGYARNITTPITQAVCDKYGFQFSDGLAQTYKDGYNIMTFKFEKKE